MRKEIMESLKSDSPQKRHWAWTALRAELRAGCTLSGQDLRFLAARAAEELAARGGDDLVRAAIAACLEALALYTVESEDRAVAHRRACEEAIALHAEHTTAGSPQVQVDVSPAPMADATQNLFQWVLEPFHEPSGVFVTVGGRNVRDTRALVELARCLSKQEFPRNNTVYVEIESRDQKWEEYVWHGYHEAVLLVGRLWLFGDRAAKTWGFKNARFGFVRQDRPADCKASHLHPDYHRMYEVLGDGRRVYYATTEADGERTDYALIQRYPVEYNGRRIVVVHCAGLTTLGTLGAAQFMASHLGRLGRPGGTSIPLPPNIEPDSTLEALLVVRADATKPSWDLVRVELCKLFVGGAVWSTRENKWETSLAITLVCDEGDPQRPLTVKFDDKVEKLEPKGRTFRLLVGLCLQAREDPNGHVDLAKLSHNAWIWGPKEVDETFVKRQLALLKVRHLHEALSITGGIRLHAKVVVAPAERVAVGVVAPKRKRRRQSDGPGEQPRKAR